MQLKHGIKVGGVQPEILLGLAVVESVFRDFKKECIVTEITGGQHMVGSFHYSGQAIDFRSKHIPDMLIKQSLLQECQEALGANFTFILEKVGDPQEHYHLQISRKLAIELGLRE